MIFQIKKTPSCFSTEDASGSTSQAAGIMEGIEAGSKVFLLDEDTSATNFMVRDSFMQKVICQRKGAHHSVSGTGTEICATKAGISTILVAGSSGAFFHIADTVIQMDSYHPLDITQHGTGNSLPASIRFQKPLWPRHSTFPKAAGS